MSTLDGFPDLVEQLMRGEPVFLSGRVNPS